MVRKQISMVDLDLNQFYKFQQKELSGLKELIKQRNTNKFDYLKQKKQLILKKKTLIE